MSWKHFIPYFPFVYGTYRFMMTSSNRNIFRVTDLLLGKSIGHHWIPLTKASDAFKQKIETPVTSDAIALIMTTL